MTMRYRIFVSILALAGLTAGLVACGDPADPALTAQQRAGERVVTSTGLADLEVGQTRATLTREHDLAQQPGDCAPRLPHHPTVSPVFDGDELVLLWADPPLHTPDGVAVGSPVGEVRTRYPDAEVLPAPPDSYRYDGLLVPVGEHAYLFLHDGETVQKLVVGYQQHARLLFHEGFGTC